MKERPQLYEYLSTRKFTNKTNKPYAFEPLDERHEEFNKRGVNFQSLRTKEGFMQSFAIVDSFLNMRDSAMKDYNIRTDFDNTNAVPNYESNIILMRAKMREEKYLDPEKNNKLSSIDGRKMSKEFLNIIDIAQEHKKNNVIKARVSIEELNLSF